MPRNGRKSVNIWKSLVIVLLVVGCAGGALYFYNSKKQVNDANLLSVDEYQIVDQKTSKGITVDVKETGKIFVSGKATADWHAVIQTISLKPGTYTVGGCNSNIGTYGIVVEKNGTPVAYAGVDGEQGATFTVEETGSYDVCIYVMEGANVYREFAPTLASGKKTIKFFE